MTELQATITNNELCLERALADTDRLKAQLAEKEEQVGFGLQVGRRTGKHAYKTDSLALVCVWDRKTL